MRLLHLVKKKKKEKKRENVGYRRFIGEQAPNKVPLLFLCVKMLVERFHQRFYML